MTRWVSAALATLLVLIPVALGAGRGEDDLVQQLDREVVALKQRIEAMQVLIEDCGGGKAPDPIFPQLVQAYSGSTISVRRRGARTVIVLPVDTLFPGDSLVIRDEAIMFLDLLATALASHPDESVLVTGHSDAEPPGPAFRKKYADNWELSVGYAHAVSSALTTRFQLDPTRVTIAGRGAQDPNDTNDTPEGRAQNRRVVVTLSQGKYP